MIIEKIKEVFPTADFSDPSWGRVDSDGCRLYSISVPMRRATISRYVYVERKQQVLSPQFYKI